MSRLVRHVAIIYGALSPYHTARARACAKLLAAKGASLSLIQRVGRQVEYPWFGFAETDSVQIVNAFQAGRACPPRARSAVQLYCALKRVNADAAAFGYTSSAYLGALGWCKLHRRKAILLSDSKMDDSVRKGWKEKLKSQLVRRFDAALAAGTPHKDYALKLGIPESRIALGNAVVDNSHFFQKAAEVRKRRSDWLKRLGLPEKFFLTCCRFIEVKNLFRLIESYQKYCEQTAEPWGLVIAGGGTLEAKLRSFADQLGVRNIVWPGLLSYEALPKYYGLASAFVLASTKDGWGLAVNEAMASGLPVILSDRLGCRYDLLREGKNGYLFDPYSVEQMADRMRQMARLSEGDIKVMGEKSLGIIADWGLERFAQGFVSSVTAAMDGC